jgi:hypothetical protein
LRLQRVDPHVFVARQIDQQFAAAITDRADESGAGEVDDRGDLPGEAGGLGFAFEDPVELVPRAQADGDQQADQREGPPEQAESQRRTSLLRTCPGSAHYRDGGYSGTKT